MTKNAIAGVVYALLAVWVSSGCASTRVVGEWRNAEVTKAGPYSKVFVVGVTTQEIVRRQFEDAFGAAIVPLGAEGLPSYGSLPAAAEAERDRVVAAVKASGADAALLVRMVKKDAKVVVSQDYYGPVGFYGGYRSAWAGQYSAVTVEQYDVITLEARLYDVATEKIVWAVSTETTDPGRIQKEITAYAQLICERMGEAGLLPKSAP